ncbi:hypothetical protein ABK040_000989 [Willaertia magna]
MLKQLSSLRKSSSLLKKSFGISYSSFHNNIIKCHQQQQHQYSDLAGFYREQFHQQNQLTHYNFESLLNKIDEMKLNIKLRELEHMVNLEEVLSKYQQYTNLCEQLENLQYLRREIAEYLAGKIPVEKLPKELYVEITEKNGGKDLVEFNEEDKNMILDRKSNYWKQKGKEIKLKIQELEKEYQIIKPILIELSLKLPNFTANHVMDFSLQNSNQPKLIKNIGEKVNFKENQKIYSHYEICERLNLFEPANECSGPKFFFLKGDGVLLELALQNYVISKLIKKGYQLIMPPELMKKHIIEGCGFQPRGEHSQIYRIENYQDTSNNNEKEVMNKKKEGLMTFERKGEDSQQLCLIGTSEIGLAALHAGQILFDLSENGIQNKPIRYVGLSHCFRTEAGAGGAKDRGLYRVHQFTKVEMFVYSSPEHSEEVLKEIVSIQEEIFSELGFHCQILDMPCNDLGNPAQRKIDIEAYIPSRGGYGEVSSASNCLDYQSRRLNIKYKVDTVKYKSFFPHTLNGTAVAIPRAIITLLENNQFIDENTGKLCVKIPVALHPFMLNGKTVLME